MFESVTRRRLRRNSDSSIWRRCSTKARGYWHKTPKRWNGFGSGIFGSVRHDVNPLGHLDLLKVLARYRVPVVVIGGHAVVFHGHIRSTEDLDVIWLRNPGSEAALVDALREVNAKWISNEVDASTGLEKLVPVTPSYVAGNHLMVLVTDQGFLDVFDYVPGCPDADVHDVFDQSLPADEVRFVSLPWLRRMKGGTDRTKDAEDLKQLE